MSAVTGFPRRLEHREHTENDKCQGKVREKSGNFQGIWCWSKCQGNVREMSGKCQGILFPIVIYSKSPQFHEIIQRRHTPAFTLSVGYMGPMIYLFSLHLFLVGVIWFVVGPPNVVKPRKCSLVRSMTSVAVENLDMLWSRRGDYTYIAGLALAN